MSWWRVRHIHGTGYTLVKLVKEGKRLVNPWTFEMTHAEGLRLWMIPRATHYTLAELKNERFQELTDAEAMEELLKAGWADILLKEFAPLLPAVKPARKLVDGEMKVCRHCGVIFVAGHSKGAYCCTAHRVAAHRARRQEAKPGIKELPIPDGGGKAKDGLEQAKEFVETFLDIYGLTDMDRGRSKDAVEGFGIILDVVQDYYNADNLTVFVDGRGGGYTSVSKMGRRKFTALFDAMKAFAAKNPDTPGERLATLVMVGILAREGSKR
jgi:hypothetical protein